MTHTINGKPWADCLKEIREFKQKSKTRKGGGGKEYGYFTINEYFQRLDETIGTDHYEVENDDFQRVQIGNGQEVFVARCRISILDDEGEVIISKTAYGGTEIMYANEGGRADIGNAPSNACKDAFKHAAELLGILGYHSFKEQAEPKSREVKDEKKQERLMELVSEGQFFEAGERDGRKVFKLCAREKVSAKQVKTEVFEIIFYPNQYKSDADKFNRFYATVDKKATTFTIKALSCGTRDGRPQFIFKGFAA